MLFAAGATDRLGSTANGSSIGDSSPESAPARRLDRTQPLQFRLSRRFVRHPRLPRLDRLFRRRRARRLAIADVAIVVVDPDPARAPLAAPALRALDELGIPHLIFVNRIDQAHGRIRDLLSALQPMSVSPLIARQIPIWDGEKISGFVDLALEYAFKYRAGQASERIEIPSELQDREHEARTQMLEQLADHDDELLEQLLMDETPSAREGPAGPRSRDRREPRRVGPVRVGDQLVGRSPAAQGACAMKRQPPDARRDPPRSERPRNVRLQDRSRLGRPAGDGSSPRRQRSPKAPTSRPADGDHARVGSLFKVQGEKTQKIGEGARRRCRRGGQDRFDQGRSMARRGQGPAAGRHRLSGAQLRDRDRTRRPQGRRQAVGRPAAAGRGGCSARRRA